jgi:hypothetical protein
VKAKRDAQQKIDAENQRLATILEQVKEAEENLKKIQAEIDKKKLENNKK